MYRRIHQYHAKGAWVQVGAGAAAILLTVSVVALSSCQAQPIEQSAAAVQPTPTIQEAKQPIKSVLICPDLEGPISLERYIPSELRQERLPSSDDPSYAYVTPPTCSISPQAGVPPYEGEAYINGRKLISVSGSPSQLTFVLPPMAPGTNKLTWFITDSEGRRGVGSKEVEWAWEDETRAQLSLGTVSQNHIAGTNNGVSFSGEYVVTPLSTNIRETVGGDGHVNYKVVWDFGDGNTKTFELSDLRAINTVFHQYGRPGSYKLSVSAEGEYGQRGKAEATVTVANAGNVAVSGIGDGGWRLTRVVQNPFNADAITELPNGNPGDDIIQERSSVGEDSITLIRERTDGFRTNVIGQTTFLVDAPEQMRSGEQISLAVSSISHPDSGEHVLRVSGTHELEAYTLTASQYIRKNESMFEFTSPVPLSSSQILTLEVSVSGCPSCTIRWVYEATE